MARGVKLTIHEFVARVTRGHATWVQDARSRSRGLRFTPHYLARNGFCTPIYRAINAGLIEEILAQCPPQVRRDWSFERRDRWTKDRIHTVLQQLYFEWLARKHDGTLNGRRWSPAFLLEFPIGKPLLRAIEKPLTVEIYLRQLSGPIEADWRRYRHAWDPETAEERVIAAHRRWQQDAVWGKQAGRRFNYVYLSKRNGRDIVCSIRDNYPGGIHRFIRSIPEIAADWQCRRRLSRAAVRAVIRDLYRQWVRDPAGLAVAMPFGPAYFRAQGRESAIHYMRRHGVGRVLSGRSFASIRRALGALPPGFRSREFRVRRAALYRRKARHAIATA